MRGTYHQRRFLKTGETGTLRPHAEEVEQVQVALGKIHEIDLVPARL